MPRSSSTSDALAPAGRWIVPLLAALGCAVPDQREKDSSPPRGALHLGSVVLEPHELAHLLDLSPVPPPPHDPTNRFSGDERAALLGQELFFDPGFSRTGEVSCATCHVPEKAWADGVERSTGLSRLDRNAPSLLDTAHNRWFFWDGRADSLWSQALQPFEDPRELGSSRLEVVHRIHGDPGLRRRYEEVFGTLPDLADRERYPARGRPVPGAPDDPLARAWEGMEPADRSAVDVAFANVGKAIAAFERRLVSGPAPFDVFAEGVREDDPRKLAALSQPALRGLKLFLGEARCSVCHDGPTFSDLEFHDNRTRPHPGVAAGDRGRYVGIGRLRVDPFGGLGPHSDSDAVEAVGKLRGLFRHEETLGQFKTPTLRNVALTAPYMHQGQVPTLEAVVRHYSELPPPLFAPHTPERILRPLHLSEEEVVDLVAFLESLTATSVPGRHVLRRTARGPSPPAAESAAR